MKTEMLWANWIVKSKSPGMEHGFVSQNKLYFILKNKGLAKWVFIYVKTNMASPFSFQLTQINFHNNEKSLLWLEKITQTYFKVQEMNDYFLYYHTTHDVNKRKQCSIFGKHKLKQQIIFWFAYFKRVIISKYLPNFCYQMNSTLALHESPLDHIWQDLHKSQFDKW